MNAFRTVENAPASAGQQHTNAAMLRMERETIGRMQDGNTVRDPEFGVEKSSVSCQQISLFYWQVVLPLVTSLRLLHQALPVRR